MPCINVISMTMNLYLQTIIVKIVVPLLVLSVIQIPMKFTFL